MGDDYFRWMNHFEVGVPELDADHREMHRRINEVCEACGRGDHRAAAEAFSALCQVSIAHFEREEKVIHSIQGHDVAGHAESHRRRAAKLLETERRMHAEGSDFDLGPLPTSLVDWFCKHAIGYDAKVRAYFHEGDRIPRIALG